MFGDTFGKGWKGSGGGPDEGDWRSNVLAKSSDTNLADGLTLSTMIQDRPGHAAEILKSDKKPPERTVIPTAGVHVGSLDCIHYMSVHRWGTPGGWLTNYSGLACSRDEGQSWNKTPVRWENNRQRWNNHFQQAAFIKRGGFVYMFGTENGRYGDVHLARVPEHLFLDKGAWQYWNGRSWSPFEREAKPVASGPAGELSVAYNSHFNCTAACFSVLTRYNKNYSVKGRKKHNREKVMV